MKITETMRRKMAFEMIDNAAAEGSLESKADRKQDHLDFIYRVAHTMSRPSCRKNHAAWVKAIDSAIRAARRQRGQKK